MTKQKTKFLVPMKFLMKQFMRIQVLKKRKYMNGLTKRNSGSLNVPKSRKAKVPKYVLHYTYHNILITIGFTTKLVLVNLAMSA